MNENIDKQLDQYSKLKFEKNLDHLGNDIRSKLVANKTKSYGLVSFMEQLFGMPISVSGGALASTLIVGILLGLQFPIQNSVARSNASDLEIFSSVNADLPSSLLDPSS